MLESYWRVSRKLLRVAGEQPENQGCFGIWKSSKKTERLKYGIQVKAMQLIVELKLNIFKVVKQEELRSK